MLAATLSCGGSKSPPQPPTDATREPPAPTAEERSPGAAHSAEVSRAEQEHAVAPRAIQTNDSTPGSEPLPAPDPLLMKPIRSTAFASQLADLGQDPAQLTPIGELSASQRLDTMDLIAESLGVECTYCHVSTNDYQTETPKKQIARQMWDRMTRGVHLESGPVFCDSCHQGAPTLLQRSRKKDVKAYMRREYGRLVGRGEGALKCEGCHGKPFEADIFGQRWGLNLEPAAAGTAASGQQVEP